MIESVIFGGTASLLIALIAYQRRSLSASGVIAAVIFATLIYIFGGLLLWILLMIFFISSSILTKINKKKLNKSLDVEKKGRDYVQVIANAFVVTIFSIMFYIFKDDIYLVAAAASIAASNADTWASEIGTLSKGRNYHILTFKPMEKGLSGAVTVLGTFASVLGALFIGLCFTVIYSMSHGYQLITTLTSGFIISFGGVLGALIDSVFGALFQAKYKDTKTGNIFENKKRAKGAFVIVSGFALITNDVVNVLSALFASVLTVVFFG